MAIFMASPELFPATVAMSDVTFQIGDLFALDMAKY